MIASYTHLFNTEPRYFNHFLNFPATANGHRHFDVEYRNEHEHILNNNRNRYETSKQGLLASFRKKEKWTGKLNFDTMIYHSDYSKSFKE